MTMSDALSAFLGPLSANYCRLIEDWARDAPVQIILGRKPEETTGGYIHHTTMGAIQDLDQAHRDAFNAKCERAAKRAAAKRAGSML